MNEEIIKLIKSRVNKTYDFEDENKLENFLSAVEYTTFNCIWICPYYLKTEYQNYISKNPIKQLENIKKFFFREFPEFNNKLVGWVMGYNREFNREDELSLVLNKLNSNENCILLY